MAATIGQLTPYINTGNNLTCRLLDGNAQLIDLGKVMEFSDATERAEIKVSPINSGGIVFHQSLAESHKFTITCAREDSRLDTLQAQIESRYYAGLPPMLYNLYVTVANQNGTTNEFLYSACDLWVMGSGSYKKDSDVQQQIEGTSQIWTQLS